MELKRCGWAGSLPCSVAACQDCDASQCVACYAMMERPTIRPTRENNGKIRVSRAKGGAESQQGAR